MSSILQNHQEAPLVSPGSAREPDLYVDLDGTLVRADVSVESFVRFAAAAPFNVFILIFWLMRGRSFAKAMVARRTKVDETLLPYRARLVEYLTEQKRAGRRLVLATASHRRYAVLVARHLGLFDRVLATTAKTNLKARHKASAIQKDCEGRPFAYAGDSPADRPVWQAAERGLLVGSFGAIERELRAASKLELHLKEPNSAVRALWKAIRPHQWVKNSLLFVALLTSQSYTSPGATIMAVIGAVLFCAVASASYLINDILDIEADRAHPRKRRRPIASGELSVAAGTAAALAMLTSAAVASLSVMPNAFTALLLIYAVTTTAYSVWLKRIATVDVIVLASLYTLRIIAGAAAIRVDPSFWLLVFSMFLFTSLAFLKRYTEVARLAGTNANSALGRGYRQGDGEALFTLGGAAGMMCVLVLALYVNSPEVRAQYAMPFLLWGLCPCALLWVARIWMSARRGEVHDDPIVHALRDKRGLILVGICACLVLAAQSAWIARLIVDNPIWR